MMGLMPSDFTAVNSTQSATFVFSLRSDSGRGQEMWLENRFPGLNKLGSMMKELSKAAKLSQVYGTNYCIRRATAITMW